MSERLCPIRACRAPLETHIDRIGRAETVCPACELRHAGLCVECRRPVSGKRWRCPRCRRARTLHNSRVFDERHREKRRLRWRKYWRTLSPEKRERRRRLRRAWNRRNLEKVRRRNREFTAKHHIAFLAYQRRYNNAHREEKRADARRRYYELHPIRPDPKCLECGTPIDWTPGRGRPALRCPTHNPWRKAS